MNSASANEIYKRLCDGLSQAFFGKPEIVEKIALAVLAGGHLLIEDVPGVGKTTAAKALARLVSRDGQPLAFRRIQFTPDLLPYDITGTDVFHPETGQFEFMPGPVFAPIVLGDEINRATPKVQSALLEVMEENQVSLGGVTRQVDPFFFVVATQNPLETEGVYPLPEAQLDRFFMKIRVGYPTSEREKAVWLGDPAHRSIETLSPVVEADTILDLRKEIAQVHVAPSLLDLISQMMERTRTHKAIALGLSPRSGVHLIKALRCAALIHGRDYVKAEDVHWLARDILEHRLMYQESAPEKKDLFSQILAEELARHEV